MTQTEDLHRLSMAGLVELHNAFGNHNLNGTAFKPCTNKTFNSKQKIIDRIEFYRSKVIHPAPLAVPAPAVDPGIHDKVEKSAGAKKSSAPPRRATVVARVNELLLDQRGLPYKEILQAIQEEFPGAKTNLNCLRWYATKLREEQNVPSRASGRAKS